MVHYCAIWATWGHMGPYDDIFGHMGPNGLPWVFSGALDFMQMLNILAKAELSPILSTRIGVIGNAHGSMTSPQLYALPHIWDYNRGYMCGI